MSAEHVAGLVIALLLFVYLGITLVFPERF